MQNSSNFLKNTIFIIIGTIFTKGLNFIFVPFYTRWILVESFGIFDLIITVLSLVIPFISLATGEAIFRFSVTSDDEEEKENLITNGLTIIILNFSCFLIFSFVAYHNLFECNNEWYIVILSLLFGQVINEHFLAFLRSVKKIKQYSVMNMFTGILIVGFTIFFVKVLDMDLLGILLGYSLGYNVGNVFVLVFTPYCRYINYKSISLITIKRLVQYSFPLIPNSVSWWIMNVSNRLLITYYIGPAANGIYALANKVPAMCSNIFNAFGLTWQQKASEIIDSELDFRLFNILFNRMFKLLLSVGIVLLSMNFLFFKWIFPKEYYEGYVYAPILIVAVLFTALSQFYGGIHISLKQPKENGISTMLGAVVNVVINFLAIKSMGLHAAVIATLVANVIVLYFRTRKLKNITIVLESNVKFIICVFFYFFITAFYISDNVFPIVNCFIALLFVCYINIDIINKILFKLQIKKV